MKYFSLKSSTFFLAFFSFIVLPTYAQENLPHAHEDSQAAHSEHGSSNPINNDEHEDGGEAHNESEAGHDESEAGHDDEHTDEHGSDENGKAVISLESAKKMGIVIEKASHANVSKKISLTGRITIDQNAIADVHGRFIGIVRNVKVNLGERVQKGQILATVEANDSLQEYNVTAPIRGVVLERNTNIGDLVSDNPLFIIADLSSVWAKFHVFLRDSSFVKIGQKVNVHNLEGDKATSGKIDMFYPTTDEKSQTQIAIVALPNPKRTWKPGMIIEGDVSVAESEAEVSVKEGALQKMEEYGDVIFAKEGKFFVPRKVEIGRKGDGIVEIIKGLKAGELYVSEGSFIVKSDILKATAAHSH
tara:strand:- start:7055 stop:8134 length:1080 start_codon:yes stop_codon:yes gene_type:complete